MTLGSPFGGHHDMVVPEAAGVSLGDRLGNVSFNLAFRGREPRGGSPPSRLLLTLTRHVCRVNGCDLNQVS